MKGVVPSSYPLFRTEVFLKLPQACRFRAVAPPETEIHSGVVQLIGGQMLFAIVRRGRKSGIRLQPHLYKKDGRYHVSLTRQGPYIPLADDRDIPEYLANGYSLHMSNPEEERSPSLIRPESIYGWK